MCKMGGKGRAASGEPGLFVGRWVGGWMGDVRFRAR